MRTRWVEAAPDGFSIGPDRAPAYLSPDRELVLFNDYGSGTAILVRPGRSLPPLEVAEYWLAPRDGAPARPLSPREAVEGYGTFTFPYGPISMGVPEAGRFDVVTYGERILELAPLGRYKPRGILPAVAGLTVPDAGLRIERIAGNVAAAHTSAFLAAAESAARTAVRTEELWVRALAQELQRVYNHLHVLARLAEAASQNVGAAQTSALAEEILRIQGRAFGHRWLFGALLPGGPPRRLDRDDRASLGSELTRRSDEFEELWELFLDSRTFIDRIQGTCSVPRASAVRWGAVGPTLRACGVAWDDRLRVPTTPYNDLFLALPDEHDGDALARLLVRVQEVRASFLLLEQLLDRWPAHPGALVPPDPELEPGRGVARVEAPSGDLVYDVRVADGRVRSVAVRTPSDANWPVFAAGMREAVFTDFHFALESFGLVFAETDR